MVESVSGTKFAYAPHSSTRLALLLASTSIAALLVSIGAAGALDIDNGQAEYYGTDTEIEGSLYVGRRDTGSLIIGERATVTHQEVPPYDAGSAYVGYEWFNDKPAIGSVTVTGAGSRWVVPYTLDIGRGGNGTVTVEHGGAVDTHLLGLGGGATGFGTLNILSGGKVSALRTLIGSSGRGNVTVSGAGSELTSSESIRLGYLGAGNGTLTIKDGGKVVSPDIVFSSYAEPVTVELLDGGILETNGFQQLSGSGKILFDGGILRAADPSARFSNTLSRGIELGAQGGTIDSNGATLAIQSQISGRGGLTKRGTGTLSLERANSFSGETNVLEGTLALAGSGSINASSVNIGDGAVFDVSAIQSARTVKGLSGGSLATIRLGKMPLYLDIAGASTFGGTIQGGDETNLIKTGAGTLTLTGTSSFIGWTTIMQGTLVTNAEALDYSAVANNNGHLVFDQAVSGTHKGGLITGFGSLEKKGAGTLTLLSDQRYTGATTVSEGTLALVFTTTFASQMITVKEGATLDLNGTNEGLTLNGIAGTGTISLGLKRLIVGNAQDNVFGGVISGTGGTTRGGVEKRGAGTLFLNGENTYTGGTTITQGGIVTHAGGLGEGPVTMAHGTHLTFDQQGVDRVFAGGPISGLGRVEKTGNGKIELQHVNTYAGGTTIAQGGIVTHAAGLGTGPVLNNGTLEFKQSTDGAFQGAISGSGSLTKWHPGKLTLGGDNTYTGDTLVNTGTLELTGDNAIGSIRVAPNANLVLSGNGSIASSRVWMTDTAEFDISGASGDREVAGLTGIGHSTVNLGANNLIVNEADSFSSFEGAISGSGGLIKRGAGDLYLMGTNTYTGDTVVEAGGLGLLPGATLNGNVRVLSGAMLGGYGDIAGNVDVASGARLLSETGSAFSMGSLNLASGSTVGTILTMPGSAAFSVLGNLTLGGNLEINALSTLSLGESYRLFDYGGTLTNNGMALANTPAGFQAGNFTINAADGKVELMIAAVTGDQYWKGGSGTWSSAPGWANADGSSLLTEWDGNTAIFGGTSGDVDVQGAQTFSNLRFESDGYLLHTTSNGELAIAGAQGGINVASGSTATLDLPVTGTGKLAKAGAGTLVLSDANTYSGGTHIQAGTLVGTATSFGTGDIENDGILELNQATSGTLTADISGTGQFLKSGSGTLELTGRNTYSGGTRIRDGRLLISSDANLGAATGGIEFVNTSSLIFGSAFDLSAGRAIVLTAGSAVFDTNGFDTTIRSTISGNGVLVKVGAGSLTLLGPNTHQETAVNQGTLVVNAHSLASSAVNTVGSGAELVFDQGADASFAHAINGSGSLVKGGAGRLNLTGTHGLTGNTFIRAGNLAVNGSLGQSHVTVGADTTLSGSGTVGGLAALDKGIVAPGNSIGTLKVAGNVTFGPGSFYDVEVNGAGQSDRIAATGIATLNGGTVRIFADQGQYSLLPYTILTAAGGVTGKFDGTEAGADFAFVVPTLGYDTNAVTLTLVRKVEPQPPGPEPVAFHSVAVSANQYRVADAVEALGEGNRLFDTVVGASAGGARQAFDALSGEAHASAATTAVMDAQRVQNSILDRLRNEAETAPRNVAYPTLDPRRVTFWGEGFGSWGKVNSNGNAAGMDTSTGGFILGAETKINETYRIGVAGGFMSTSFDIDGRLSSGTTESVLGSIYGAAKWDAVNVRLGMIYAHHDVDVNRTISLPGFRDKASASYNGSTLLAFGEIGYEFDLGKTKVEPFLGASVMRLHLDSFREDDGPAALVGYGRTYELGTTTIGIRAETQLGTDLPLTLRGLVGWRHAFGDVNPSTLLAFSGGVSAFEVSGVPLDRNAFVAEAGLDWQIAKDMTLGVSYAGQIGRRAQEHAVKGNFTWHFETR
ncbi:autotransporter-associated beta strand repeat-containing protein [Microvirga sp. M2]|uniref:autotransporter-associated beta strand repeat-containing protein n=1 Tax=Microvirga sp. M2 TaxID=3073270 RepID=UPI0039C34AFA